MSSRLAEELKQTKPFDSREEEVYLQVLRTAEVLARGMAETLKPFDLTLTQYNVLRILRGAGDAGLRCADVSERLITHDSDITRLLDRLTHRRLVGRRRDRRDRRAVVSTITPAGFELLARLDNPVRRRHAELLDHLPKRQLETLGTLLERARYRNDRH